MKKTLLATNLAIFLSVSMLNAQKVSKLPESKIPSSEPEMHLRFLASDEMQGKRTTERGNLIAARYIGEQMRILGLKPMGDNGTYLQKVPFKNVMPANEGTLTTSGGTAKILDDFLVAGGGETAFNVADAPVIFMDFAWKDDKIDEFKGVDVKGKIIVASLGSPSTTSPFESMQASEEKGKWAKEAGAIALVEIFSAKVKWSILTGFFNQPRLMLDMSEGDDKKEIPHLWLSLDKAKTLIAKEKTKTMSLNLGSRREEKLPSYNVIGVIEGSDPVLKNEYIVLSAHHDHVGTGKNGGGKFSEKDSIFNGSRDNAFGVAAVLFAAKALTQQKPKRSILVIGFTGEELGLLGSKYYAEHPTVPMKNCVYNLNCDGAGYSDTKIMTIFGLDRTDCKGEIVAANKAFGLEVIDDPAPEQNLFDRSDNVNFAAKGVPAPTYSPGFRAFDDKIFKYYHSVEDNPETIDFAYLYKYCQTYAYTARLIANRKNQPKWAPGDKYEAAYKKLYGSK